MKIAFYTVQLDLRGSCIALYDYANYNELLLNNESIILVPRNSLHNEEAFIKFSRRFRLVYFTDSQDMENKIADCNVLYCIKYGIKNMDPVESINIKTVIHCVFDLSDPHGSVYAAVSETLANKYGKTEFVPHMVSLKPSITKENMRVELNIPNDAIVFGRHGGIDTFNFESAHKAIIRSVNDINNIHFVFVNTPHFYEHPHIHYIDRIMDLDVKNAFICTCDAHLECGTLGHTFGLSIAEFSVNNKPIIAYNTNNLWNRAHIDILKDNAIYFTTENELYEILTTFNPKIWEVKDNNCYKEYSPILVMKKFNDVFLKT